MARPLRRRLLHLSMRAHLLPSAFLLLFFAFPLATTLVAAGDADAWRWVMDDYARRRLAGAAWQATLSVLATFALAVPLAWHHHARAVPFARVHMALHAAPFVLPVFVVVGAARELLGPNGWSNQWFGVNGLAVLGPLGVVVLAHAYYNYGFTARLLHAALERRPARLEAAAAVLGAGPWHQRLRVTVPLLAPTIASTALLVWLFSFSSFGVVLLLGNGALSTPETLIYQNLRGAFPQPGRAAVLGAVQLALNAGLLLAYLALQRRTAALPRDPAPRRSGGPMDRVLAGTALGLALVPLLAVLVGGFRVQGQWTLDAWRALLNAAHPDHLPGFDLAAVLLRTLGYAAASSALALGLAASLAYGMQRVGRWRRVLEPFASLPLGTSSVLLGLGYLLAFGAGRWLDLRGARVAIVIVHSLIAFPFVARILMPALDQHDRRFDETAALLGANPRAVTLRVHWPMLRGPVLAAVGLAAAISFGDFGASLLLARRGTAGLAVWIGEHDVPFRAIMHAQSIALTTILMVLAAGAYLAVERFRPREANP